MEIPEIIKNKVEIINLKNKWEKLPLNKKSDILNIFNLNTDELEKIRKTENNKILLITQPFSEDKFMSEEEKIELYKNIIKQYDFNEILIKPHPRETTNYNKIFPKIKVIRGNFPLEILMVLGVKFKEVVTVYSTAALNFKGICNINYLGTVSYPEIKEKVGEIKSFYDKV